ncbi:MAG: ATP phosphoribosyltransferase regulatory subunit, partial [Deltaproteobacteria bacterium]|nr:ATP phosphoribosyltransferase regulatory subunit [Deltaproteobacteria bacterium]
PRSARSIVEALPTLYGPRPEVCKRARGLRLPKALKAALAETEAVLELAASSMPAEVHDTISFDLGEVRGFDYYTGIRFRGFADGVGHAVLRGGRYDQLVGRYGRDAVATGFAIDVEAVAEAQDVVGIAAPAPARGLYLVVGPGKRRQANRVAASLRGLGHRVAVQVVAAARERNQARDRAVAGGWTHLLFWSDGWHGQGPTGEAAMTANVEAAASGRPAALSRWIRQGD